MPCSFQALGLSMQSSAAPPQHTNLHLLRWPACGPSFHALGLLYTNLHPLLPFCCSSLAALQTSCLSLTTTVLLPLHTVGEPSLAAFDPHPLPQSPPTPAAPARPTLAAPVLPLGKANLSR